MLEKLLTPAQTAEALGTTVQTLAVWRCTKRYALPYVKIGRSVMYRETDVQKFIESRLQLVS
ncbi:Helix-turn-helix domain protein [compost metagenome]